jgi:hypothetical protein
VAQVARDREVRETAPRRWMKLRAPLAQQGHPLMRRASLCMLPTVSSGYHPLPIRFPGGTESLRRNFTARAADSVRVSDVANLPSAEGWL